jgi:hypothetical protein
VLQPGLKDRARRLNEAVFKRLQATLFSPPENTGPGTISFPDVERRAHRESDD